jgi:ATP synthase protein I
MPEHSEESLEERRRRLGASLGRMAVDDEKEAKAEASAEVSRKGMAVAVKLSSEFVSAIIVGAGLGWLFDWFFGTLPWGLVVLLLLGFCAGILNVLRATGTVTAKPPLVPKDKGDESNRNNG